MNKLQEKLLENAQKIFNMKCNIRYAVEIENEYLIKSYQERLKELIEERHSIQKMALEEFQEMEVVLA